VVTYFENSPNTNTLLFTCAYFTHITIQRVSSSLYTGYGEFVPSHRVVSHHRRFRKCVNEFTRGLRPADFASRLRAYILLDNLLLTKPSFCGLSSISIKLPVLNFWTGVTFTWTWHFGVHSLLSVHPRICSRNYFRWFRIYQFLGTW
jgi:hypothetical protein